MGSSHSIHRNIYKHGNRYEVVKKVNKKNYYFGSYHNLEEAMQARDYYESLDWIKPEPTHEENLKKLQKEYYHRICLNHNKTRYSVNGKPGIYLGTVDTIEEALYLRDKYYDETNKKNIPYAYEQDLKKDNPYIINGLDYPLPERLIKSPPRTNGKGFGVIRKRNNHYRLEQGGKYYTSCATYEQAYFYHQEFNKRGWDKKNIPLIEADYPAWYTWLNKFYIYIIQDTYDPDYWLLNLTPKNNGKFEQIRYANIEDALWERDFLIKHDWNYDLLVEAIDDTVNPYYNMDLPPYPERKIRHIQLDNNLDNKIRQLANILMEYPDFTRDETAEYMGISDVTIGNWLRKYNTNWREFKKIVATGDDPLQYISMPEHIYQPDLSFKKPKHHNNHVQKNKSNKTNPWRIIKDGRQYGVYPNEKVAHKISNELQRLGWTMKNVRMLQEKYDCPPQFKKANYIYTTPAGHYLVRRKKKGSRKNIIYGTYHTRLEAELIRELLNYYGWDKKNLPFIREKAQEYYLMIIGFKNNMFKGTDGVKL